MFSSLGDICSRRHFYLFIKAEFFTRANLVQHLSQVRPIRLYVHYATCSWWRYLRLSFCKAPRTFSLVTESFLSVFKACSKMFIREGIWERYMRPGRRKQEQASYPPLDESNHHNWKIHFMTNHLERLVNNCKKYANTIAAIIALCWIIHKVPVLSTILQKTLDTH